MMTGKAYSRASGGQMMSAYAVLSLLLEEFRHTLTTIEQAKLNKIQDSTSPVECTDNPIALHLMQWSKAKVEEVSSKSRTAVFGLAILIIQKQDNSLSKQ